MIYGVMDTLLLSVWLNYFVCLSHVDIVSKWLNLGSHKQRHTIARVLQFFMPKISVKFKWDHPLQGAKWRWGSIKSVTFDNQRAITRKRYKIDA